MNDLVGGEGELRMTIHIKRADTGAVETYELTGKCTEDEARESGALIVSDPAEE